MQKKKRMGQKSFAFSVGYTWTYIVGRELTHMRSMCVGVAETGAEGVARSVTDEESFYKET